MKKNRKEYIALFFLVILTGLLVLFINIKFPTNMAKVGYYAPISYDSKNLIQREYTGLMICYENRGLSLGYASYIPTDIEHPADYSELQYNGNKIIFKNRATKETSLIGELNGDEITIADDTGNQATYVWKGIPKEFGPFECVKDEAKAMKEIRANEEKRKKAFLGIILIDILVIGFIAGAFVWRKGENLYEKE